MRPTAAARSDHRRSTEWAGVAAALRGRPELQQSVACLQRVLALNPNNAQARSWLALAQAASGSTGGSSTRPAADRHVVGKLGEYLVELGFVTTGRCRRPCRCRPRQRRPDSAAPIGEILVAQGLVTPAQVEQALREQLRDVYTLFVDQVHR